MSEEIRIWKAMIFITEENKTTILTSLEVFEKEMEFVLNDEPTKLNKTKKLISECNKILKQAKFKY